MADPIPSLAYPLDASYPVTQRFDGHAVDYYPWRGHPGVDFGAPEGAGVFPVAEGTVITVATETRGGNVVYIAHPWGRSYYAHLSAVYVREGQPVSRANRIGLVGSTGLATGPHLHLGLYPTDVASNNGYGGAVDPAPYLSTTPSHPPDSGSVLPLTGPVSCGAQALGLLYLLGLGLGAAITRCLP